MSVSGGPDSAESGQYRVPGGLLEKLMAAVRPEFRSDELVFDPADPVFGGAICRADSCPRTARGGQGLCDGHHDRWTAQGRPDLDAFVAAPGPGWLGHAPLAGCRAPGCGRGVRGHGLCPRHSDARERAGRPDVDEWLAGVPAAETRPGQQECLVGFCGLWAEHGTPFCLSHGSVMEGRRPSGAGQLRQPVSRRGPRPRLRAHLPGRAPPAAEAGDPVRAAAPPRRSRGQGAAPRRHEHGPVPGLQRSILAAGAHRAGMEGRDREEAGQDDRPAGLVPPAGRRPGRRSRRMPSTPAISGSCTVWASRAGTSWTSAASRNRS